MPHQNGKKRLVLTLILCDFLVLTALSHGNKVAVVSSDFLVRSSDGWWIKAIHKLVEILFHSLSPPGCIKWYQRTIRKS